MENFTECTKYYTNLEVKMYFLSAFIYIYARTRIGTLSSLLISKFLLFFSKILKIKMNSKMPKYIN